MIIILENFKITKLIVKNENTEIYEVIHIHTNQKAILKILNQSTSALKTIQTIKHENLVNLFLIELNENNNVCTVEEYVDGQTLDKILELGKVFSNQEIYDISISLCDALCQLHSNRVIHRDIKPSNIFLTNTNKIKLFDYGATRLFGNIVDTTLLGTEGYAPPEQYGFSSTDTRSDVYALGVTLYEIIENKRFSNDFQSCRRYKKIIKKATSLSPQDRYNSVSDLKRDILNYNKEKFAYITIPVLICLSVGFLYLSDFSATEFVSNFTDNQNNAIEQDMSDLTLFENPQNLQEDNSNVDDVFFETDIEELTPQSETELEPEPEPELEPEPEPEPEPQPEPEPEPTFAQIEYKNEPSLSFKYVVNQSIEEIYGNYYFDGNGSWQFSSDTPFDDMGLTSLFPDVRFVTPMIPEKHVICEIVNNGNIAITNPTVNFKFTDVFLTGKNYYDQPYLLTFSGHVNGIGAYTEAKFQASNLTINPGDSYKFIFDLDSSAVLSENATVQISVSSAQTQMNTFNVPVVLS